LQLFDITASTIAPWRRYAFRDATAKKVARGAACSCRGDSGFQLAQVIGQQPQGAVEANIGINAPHLASLLVAIVGVAPMQIVLVRFSWVR